MEIAWSFERVLSDSLQMAASRFLTIMFNWKSAFHGSLQS